MEVPVGAACTRFVKHKRDRRRTVGQRRNVATNCTGPGPPVHTAKVRPGDGQHQHQNRTQDLQPLTDHPYTNTQMHVQARPHRSYQQPSITHRQVKHMHVQAGSHHPYQQPSITDRQVKHMHVQAGTHHPYQQPSIRDRQVKHMHVQAGMHHLYQQPSITDRQMTGN